MKVEIHSGNKIMNVAGQKRREGYRDGPGDEAMFKHPEGLTFHSPFNSPLAVDSGNKCIRRISLTLGDNYEVTTVAGIPKRSGHRDGPSHLALLNQVCGFAIDEEGGIIVTDAFAHCIRRITPDGKEVTTIAGVPLVSCFKDGLASSEARLNSPYQVILDAPRHSMYIADRSNNLNRSISSGGREQYQHQVVR